MNNKDRDPKELPDDDVVKPLIEDEDFYVENGLYVFTAKYLLERGYCCNNGCRHCPYKGPANKAN